LKTRKKKKKQVALKEKRPEEKTRTGKKKKKILFKKRGTKCDKTKKTHLFSKPTLTPMGAELGFI
jgi:hypothetical protein